MPYSLTTNICFISKLSPLFSNKHLYKPPISDVGSGTAKSTSIGDSFSLPPSSKCQKRNQSEVEADDDDNNAFFTKKSVHVTPAVLHEWLININD